MPLIQYPITKGWAWEREIDGFGTRQTGICSDKTPICMSVWTVIPQGGGIRVEAASPWISIADLMNALLASDITFNTFEFLGYSAVPFGAFAATALRIHTLKGLTEEVPVDIQTTYGSWNEVLSSVNLVLASGGVPQYDKVQIKLFHHLDSAFQHSVLAFGGTPQMNLLVTTLAGTSEVTFRVIDAKTGFALPNVGITGTNGTPFSGRTGTDGTVILTVYDGSYTVTARKYIEGKWYSGSTKFTAPVTGEVLIQVNPERFTLPWWAWASIIGGAILGAFIVLRKPKPSVIVVRER